MRPQNQALPHEELSGSVRTSYLLAQAYFALRVRIEGALRPLGLTGLQLTILSTLKNRQGMSSADLARRYHKTPQGMGQMLNALAERGYIERSEDPVNRRVLRVNLTPEGRKALTQGDAAMARVEKATFDDMDPGTLEVLRGALHTLDRRHPPA